MSDSNDPLTLATERLEAAASHFVDGVDKGLAELTGEESTAILAEMRAVEQENERLRAALKTRSYQPDGWQCSCGHFSSLAAKSCEGCGAKFPYCGSESSKPSAVETTVPQCICKPADISMRPDGIQGTVYAVNPKCPVHGGIQMILQNGQSESGKP